MQVIKQGSSEEKFWRKLCFSGHSFNQVSLNSA